ncbi:MAG: hypothetical protein IKR89_13460 [Bacteroidaceae bacterium]|nr:hypothetical protein [Bacteroidaceae bacterium]
MKGKTLLLLGGITLLAACSSQQATNFDAPEATLTTIGNPYIPLWDHIPDGEPYVFDDPDTPGKKRVYVYGSHDIEVKKLLRTRPSGMVGRRQRLEPLADGRRNPQG